jgi:hypothetical protein
VPRRARPKPAHEKTAPLEGRLSSNEDAQKISKLGSELALDPSRGARNGNAEQDQSRDGSGTELPPQLLVQLPLGWVFQAKAGAVARARSATRTVKRVERRTFWRMDILFIFSLYGPLDAASEEILRAIHANKK